MYLSLVLPLLFVGHVAVAKPDVAGTRTVVISLATGESGQIIPFVLHRNSHGFDPITIFSTKSTGSSVFSDTSFDWTSSDIISTSDAGSEESTVVSIEVSSTAESSVESSIAELSTETSVIESASEPVIQSSVAESSVAEPSVTEQVSTSKEDLGSGSDSDSDNEESKKSVAVNSTSHTSKKSSASTYTLPSSAFLAIPACLFAVTFNRPMF
ncbi:hypothetical protein GGH94_000831 [Coemansia aciculifera]|uniref:Uncharacterized protein n=1 Tax=Coemansia aciculifera TaxID=417176 RepID=A0A9W8IVZ0_9FUNG|nr:hypothetical protein GGH94_000831 [Coemansia aciculifera]